ncbi:MAG: fibronectin-binding domain-containing protein [Clostridia bacterium]|nr:fibronectin-binding domain-containing protein [Clostridia bacterium]
MELTARAGIDPDYRLEFMGEYEYQNLNQSLIWLKNLLDTKEYQPTLVNDNDDNPIAFAPFFLQQFSDFNQAAFSSMSSLVEFFIGRLEEKNIFKQKASDLEKIIERELERCQRKLALQMEKIAEGKEAEKYRLWGELIIANLYHLQQAKEARVINLYSEKPEEIIIPLDSNLTPNENAQKYFKKYSKAKQGAQKAADQSKATVEEISYLESIKNSLERAEKVNDLQEIRLELEESGYVKAKTIKTNKTNIQPQSDPLTFQVKEYKILVGKNNKQNDYITFKLGKNEDMWLHVKDIPGSHVIIKNPGKKEIPKSILDEAANLAAYYSKGRYSALVPVDYTLRKNVKKPGGAKPGMVIYENQKTIYITPDEEKVLQLLKNQS